MVLSQNWIFFPSGKIKLLFGLLGCFFLLLLFQCFFSLFCFCYPCKESTFTENVYSFTRKLKSKSIWVNFWVLFWHLLFLIIFYFIFQIKRLTIYSRLLSQEQLLGLFFSNAGKNLETSGEIPSSTTPL